MEFVRNLETKERFPVPIGTLIGRRALENGLITRFDPNWIALGPPLSVGEREIDEILSILDRSTGEVLAEMGAA